MSSNVYFDFHTPEVYPLWNESWSKWYSKLVQLELNNTSCYFTEKVSDKSTLVVPNNEDVWEFFQEEHAGKLIDRSLIAKIITDWRKLYQESQAVLNSIGHSVRNDMMTAGQIKILLKKYKGYHLVFRTD
jgi:hypothetical protein